MLAAEPNFIRALWLGRVARLRYFLGSLFGLVFSLLLTLLVVVLWGFIIISEVVSPASGFMASLETAFGSAMPFLVALAILAPIYFLHAVLAIRRYHDIGWSGWFYLLLWIPIVNIVFALILLFKKGQPETNKYGTPLVEGREFSEEIFNAPPGKKRFLKILGSFAVLVFVLTILATWFSWQFPKTPVSTTNLSSASALQMSLTQTIHMSLITAALMSYQHKNQYMYPESLNGLAPKYLPSIPSDDNGQPFQYQTFENNLAYQICASTANGPYCISDSATSTNVIEFNQSIDAIDNGGQSTSSQVSQ